MSKPNNKMKVRTYGRGEIMQIDLGKLTGKKLRRFIAAMGRVNFEGATELEITETRHWLTLQWRFGSMVRQVSIGPRGDIKPSERAWWDENTVGPW